jgi:hypothetical protein
LDEPNGDEEEVKRVLLFLLLISCSSPPLVHFDNADFVVELAKTDAERQKGLMFRESMPDNHGMLFFFDNVSPRSFWMKNTLIPLDMIFVDDNWTVVHIANAVPCTADPCPGYSSPPAKYVLEINGGLAEKSNITLGSKLSLSE